jgi:hypothetical protein
LGGLVTTGNDRSTPNYIEKGSKIVKAVNLKDEKDK